MKKKVLVALFMIMCMILAACGGKDMPTTEEPAAVETTAEETAPAAESTDAADTEAEPIPETPKEPVSLIGTWADKENDVHVAVVDEDTITVYWVMDDGYKLYWTGNYEVPEKYCEDFTWESVNFKDITDYALYASTSDTKEFRYKDGAIMYEGSMQGEAFTITLTPARIIGIQTKKPGSAANALAEKQKLELIDHGYSVSKSGKYIDVPYTAVIHNPNEGFAVEYPKIIITCRDESGAILNNEEQTLNYIAASDTITYSNYAFWEGSVLPSSVEISVKTGKDDYTVQSDEFLTADSFEFKNISVKKDSWFTKVTGEITNLADRDVDSIAVSVNFMKDGKYIGGDTSYVDEIDAGDTAVFDISVTSDIEDYDEVVLSGNEW